MTVYLDVLFLVNLYTDYLLLLLTTRFLHLFRSRWRLLCGALCGAVGACAALLLPCPAWVVAVGNVLLTVGMVCAAFAPLSVPATVRAAGVLYMEGVLLMGVLAVLQRFLLPNTLFVYGGAVYLQISLPVLFAFTCGAYLLLSVCGKIIGRREDDRDFVQVRIQHLGQSVTFLAKVDTGNTLTEPFSGLPVLVGDEKTLGPVLPPGVLQPPGTVCDPQLRLVPFHAVNSAGLLPAYLPQQVWLCGGKEKTAAKKPLHCYVALCKNPLPTGALINPDALTG